MSALDPSSKAIGRRLKQLRLQSGLTQQQLSHRVGSSPQQIHRYEAGRQELKAAVLWRLCTAMDTDVSGFFRGLGVSAPPPPGLRPSP